MMSSGGSESIQLAPGHRCLLNLLQRKLLTNVENYARLSLKLRHAKLRDIQYSEASNLADGRSNFERGDTEDRRQQQQRCNQAGNNSLGDGGNINNNHHHQQHHTRKPQLAQNAMPDVHDEEDVELIECELTRLRDKIRRISARQKRYTMELINGNGNNTIPKEEFFSALGLVTKEALAKLNSKSNQRRRRTTANPRFSHEAVQARKLLEPLQKKLDRESRQMRDSTNRKGEQIGRKSQRTQSQNNKSNATGTHVQNNNNFLQNNAKNNRNQQLQDNNNNNSGTNRRNNNSRNASNNNNKVNHNQQASNGANTASNEKGPHPSSTRSQRQQQQQQSSGDNKRDNSSARFAIQTEHRELLAQYNRLQQELANKSDKVKAKRESNEKLEKQNEIYRKKGLDLLNTMKLTDDTEKLLSCSAEQQASAKSTGSNINNRQCQSKSCGKSTAFEAQNQAQLLKGHVGSAPDFLINMQCDESLDGVD